jgi:hypothetical protein
MTRSIGTIRELIDHDYSLTAWCSACQHSHIFDLQKLGERLGFDHATIHDDLTPKLKCSKCGSRKVGIILTYDDPRQRSSRPMVGRSN